MPQPADRNIPIDVTFARQVERLRIERKITKSELADRAGLTSRTVRDLINGRKTAILDKTLMLLAEALGVEPTVLLEHSNGGAPDDVTTTPFRTTRRILPLLGLTAVLLVAIASWATLRTAAANATWTIDQENEVFEVRDSVFNRVLWQLDARVVRCIESPWNRQQLILGFGSETDSGKSILCLQRATGDTVWSAGPDIEAIRRAFGAGIVDAAGFSCNFLLPADLQGDGEPELVVTFAHGLYYPFAICVVDRYGRRESQYVNKGVLFDVTVDDLDGNGCDEIIGAGVNNDPAYLGATIIILNDHNRHGAAVDDLANPESVEVDGSWRRLVIPQLPAPYMKLLKGKRLTAYNLRVAHLQDGGAQITVDLGHNNLKPFMALLDTDLKLTRIVLADHFSQSVMVDWPDSLILGTGLGDEAWRSKWLAGMRIFQGQSSVAEDNPSPADTSTR